MFFIHFLNDTLQKKKKKKADNVNSGAQSGSTC